MRKFTLDRWNWSERCGKWVYVTKRKGKRNYYYQLEPPKEFIELTMQIKKVNDKLMATQDPVENMKLFNQLIKIAHKLQSMGRGDI